VTAIPTSLVTGATNGIGLETARALARLGHKVVMVSRNPDKCRRVVEELRAGTGNPNVDFIAADLSSLAEVRRAAAEFRERSGRLDRLVNNAGVSLARRRESADGFEYMFALNHLAGFLLTGLLLDLLVSSAPSRVVNVASGMYPQAKLDLDDLQSKRRFSAMTNYANSKLCDVLFTTELARRLTGTKVTVNAAGPGLVKTNIGQEEGGLFAFSKRMADFFGGKTPEQGAETIFWLATAQEVEGISGRYFEKRKEPPLAPKALEPGLALRLWQASESLAGFRYPVPANRNH
jgi:NAD(P)-dependent dehydrogenase (short-subunit alcohol dehydrogenase family)